MKIALAGGGDASDSRLLDGVFAGWLGSGGRMLYWPIALRGIRPYSSCLEWIKATFSPLGITRITMWTDLSEHRAGELDRFDGIYIGGGNTYALLAQIQESGFWSVLGDYAKSGKPIYGGSAGAILLGRDIRSANHFDRKIADLKDTRGLDLAGGHTIWPHYQPHDDDLINAYIRECQQTVLAIPERSGIAIDEAGMQKAGFEPAYLFELQDKEEI